MDIYVISLTSAHSRRQGIQQQFDTAKIDFEFFDAVRANETKHDFRSIDKGRCILNSGRLVTPLEVACFSSHKRLWQLSAMQNRSIVIFEDDVELSECISEGLEVLDTVIARFDFIKLETAKCKSQKQKAFVNGFTISVLNRCPHSAAAYAISPNTARQLLCHSSVLTGPVDVFIKQYWRHGQAIHRIEPDLASLSVAAANTMITDRPQNSMSPWRHFYRQLYKLRGFVERAMFNTLLPLSKGLHTIITTMRASHLNKDQDAIHWIKSSYRRRTGK